MIDRSDDYSVHHQELSAPPASGAAYANQIVSRECGNYGRTAAYAAMADQINPDPAQYEKLRAFLDHWVIRGDRSDGSGADWLEQKSWEYA